MPGPNVLYLPPPLDGVRSSAAGVADSQPTALCSDANSAQEEVIRRRWRRRLRRRIEEEEEEEL